MLWPSLPLRLAPPAATLAVAQVGDILDQPGYGNNYTIGWSVEQMLNGALPDQTQSGEKMLGRRRSRMKSVSESRCSPLSTASEKATACFRAALLTHEEPWRA